MRHVGLRSDDKDIASQEQLSPIPKGRVVISIASGVLTVRSSYGISITVTRASAGLFSVSFASQGNAYYPFWVGAAAASGIINLDANTYGKTATGFSVNCYVFGGASTDPEHLIIEVG